MGAVAYRVTVYNSQIKRLFARGGDADDWIYRVSSQQIALARATAPSRTGTLRAAHRIRRGSRVGSNQYQSRYIIENIAEHAEWVHDGTRPTITPDDKDFLSVPKRESPFRYKLKPSVSGQADQPWLDDACAEIAMRYGAIIVRV